MVHRADSKAEVDSHGERRPTVRLAVLTTYPPRRCGIATYSAQLLAHLGSLDAVQVVAIGGADAGPYPPEVADTLEMTRSAYAEAAHRLRDRFDCLLVQHEFGLYGGRDGRDVLLLLQAWGRPAIVTLHTVLSSPTRGQLEVVRALAGLSTKLLVFSQHAGDLLREVYHVPSSRVVVVPHGATVVPPDDALTATARSVLGVVDRQVLLTSGFIGPNKGIEYALRAVELVAPRYPRLLYAIVGQPHPRDSIAGEYARGLSETIARSPYRDQVLWVNQHVSDGELARWMAAADVCVLPYVEPEQVSSGVLARYLGMGRAIISTDFPYAAEVLGTGGGCLVPMRDEHALVAGIDKLLSDADGINILRRAAFEVARPMAWREVARVHAATIRVALEGSGP